MENLVEVNVDDFKSKYLKILSSYFNNLFSGYFKKISYERKNQTTGYFIFDIEIDEKCANPLNIAHGGALATLIENLATVCLYYFGNQRYKTLDISINYKSQVELNQEFQIYLKCEKIGFNTSFVEVEIRKKGEVCTQASIIKAKIIQNAKF
jgi:acyl-coenzyme A thioesterase PaaI-like protein